jgi:hypothetical protein
VRVFCTISKLSIIVSADLEYFYSYPYPAVVVVFVVLGMHTKDTFCIFKDVRWVTNQ